MKAILNENEQHEILVVFGRAADTIAECKQKLDYYQHKLAVAENNLRRAQLKFAERWPTEGDYPDDDDETVSLAELSPFMPPRLDDSEYLTANGGAQ